MWRRTRRANERAQPRADFRAPRSCRRWPRLRGTKRGRLSGLPARERLLHGRRAADECALIAMALCWLAMPRQPVIRSSVRDFRFPCARRECFATNLRTIPIGRLQGTVTRISISGIFVHATRWRDGFAPSFRIPHQSWRRYEREPCRRSPGISLAFPITSSAALTCLRMNKCVRDFLVSADSTLSSGLHFLRCFDSQQLECFHQLSFYHRSEQQ